MFIGHFGLSFAAKKAVPKISLAILFIATQFVDILWPILVMLHIETVDIMPGYTKTNAFEFLHFPYTHSLLMGFVWGVITALLYAFFKKDTRGAIVIGLCVLSHWFLDLIVHTTDLPITLFGNTKVGLGLWNHVAAALILETIIFLAGVFIYASITTPKNKKGFWGLWLLVVFLLLIYLYNTFGPPPKEASTNLFMSLFILMAVIVLVAGWVDKNRVVKKI